MLARGSCVCRGVHVMLAFYTTKRTRCGVKRLLSTAPQPLLLISYVTAVMWTCRYSSTAPPPQLLLSVPEVRVQLLSVLHITQ